MKISTRIEASESIRTKEFDVEEDLKITESQWEQMTEEQRHTVIEVHVMNIPFCQQPFWMLDSFDKID